MKFLITRPEPQASASKKRLLAMGHSVIREPCQEVRGYEAVLQDADAYIVTSLNGVEYGLKLITNKQAVIFAVGERTAMAAEDLGFQEIYAAEGDSESLLEMVISRWLPEHGSLLHLSGTEIVSDISALLSAIGYSATRQAVYEAVRQEKPTLATLDALKNQEIDAILFYSARAVTIFNQWMNEAGFEIYLKDIIAVALSQRIASGLGNSWKYIKVAQEPNENDLIKAATGSGIRPVTEED